MKNVQFYRNELSSSGGYFLGEILTWGRDQWEASHEEIQWVWPTKQESAFNPDAPILTDDEIHLFKDDPELRDKFQETLGVVSGVFGMRLVEGDFSWRDDCDFDPKWWFRKFGHNHLRMSRLMDCLCKLGMKKESWSLFCLLVTDEEVEVNEITCDHWKKAASGEK